MLQVFDLSRFLSENRFPLFRKRSSEASRQARPNWRVRPQSFRPASSAPRLCRSHEAVHANAKRGRLWFAPNENPVQPALSCGDCCMTVWMRTPQSHCSAGLAYIVSVTIRQFTGRVHTSRVSPRRSVCTPRSRRSPIPKSPKPRCARTGTAAELTLMR